ncbi:hypothetical protein ACLOJK_020083 [Asimina triloba]
MRTEKTGIDRFSRKQAVIFLCATNRPGDLDPEFLRPGRIDRRLFIDLPDAEQRIDIFDLHSSGMQFMEDVDFRKLVFRTSGFSGADIRSLINEAAIMSIWPLEVMYEAQNNIGVAEMVGLRGFPSGCAEREGVAQDGPGRIWGLGLDLLRCEGRPWSRERGLTLLGASPHHLSPVDVMFRDPPLTLRKVRLAQISCGRASIIASFQMFEPESTNPYGIDASLTEGEQKKLIIAGKRSEVPKRVDLEVLRLESPHGGQAMLRVWIKACIAKAE